MAKGPRYDIDIHFKSNINSIKDASQQLDKIRQKIAQIESKGVSSAAEKNMLQHMKKYEASLSRTLNKAREQTSHMIRGTVEYNETLQKTFKTFNLNAAKALKTQEQLNAAVKEQIDLEQRLAREQARVAADKEKKGLAARTKRALGQSFLEAPLYSASFAVLAGIGTSLQNFVELDKVLTRIGIVTGRNTESMKQFAHYAGEAGKALGVTGKAFADASLTFLQQGGLAADYASSLAESSIKLANITGANASDTSEYVTAIANSFRLLETDGVRAGDKIADMLASLDAASGSSADEIAGAFKRSASSFAAAGFSAEEASAMIAVVSETTRQSSEMVGTGFKTMIGNLAEVKAGTAEAEAITNQLQKVSQQFGLNFSLVDEQTGDMKKVPQILSEVANLYNTTNTEAAKNALIEAVAGKEQRDRFIALITNQERYNELLNIAKTSSGAADEANRRYLDSSQAKIDIIKNEWEELTTKLLEGDSFKNFLDQVAATLSKINSSVDNFGEALLRLSAIVIPLVLALNQSKMKASLLESGAGGAVSGVYSQARQAGKGRFEAGKAVFSKGLESGKSFVQGAGKLGKIGSLIKGAGIGGVASGIFGVIEAFDIINSKDSGVNKFTSLLGAAAPVIGSFFGPIGIGVGLLAKMGIGMLKVNKETQDLTDEINKNKAALKESLISNESQVDGLIKTLETLPEGSKEYVDAANELAAIAPQLSTGTDAFGNAVLMNIDSLKEYISVLKDQIALEEKAANKKAAKASMKKAETAAEALKSTEEKIVELQNKIASGGTLTQEEGTSSVSKWTSYTKKEISSFEKEINELQVKANTFSKSIGDNFVSGLILESKTRGFSDEDQKYFSQGISKLVTGPDAEKYYKEYNKKGAKKFFENYKEAVITEGRKSSDAIKAVQDIISGDNEKIKKIDWGTTSITSIADEVMAQAKITEEELVKGNYLQPIITALEGGYNKLSASAKKLRFDEIAKLYVPKSNFFDPSIFSSAVVNAENSAGALAQAATLMMEAGIISTTIQELVADGLTLKDYSQITKLLKSTKNFKLKFGNVTGKEAAADFKEAIQQNQAGVLKSADLVGKFGFVDQEGLKTVTQAGKKVDLPTGDTGKDDSYSTKLSKQTDKIEGQIESLQRQKNNILAAIEDLEPGSDKWVAKQDQVVALNRKINGLYADKLKIAKSIAAGQGEISEREAAIAAIDKQILDLKKEINKIEDTNKIEQFNRLYGIRNSKLSQYNAQLANTVKGSEEYKKVQNEIIYNMKEQYRLTGLEIARLEDKKNKKTISPDELKRLEDLVVQRENLAKSLNDFVKQNAGEAFDQVLYGTEDVEKLRREYGYLKQLTDDILDSHEQLIEKSQIQANIQKEIEESSNQVYKNNLKVVQSNLKNATLTKQGLAALKSQITLLKALSEASGAGNLRLTKTASGEFRYAAQSTAANKSAAIEAAAAAEQAAIEQFRSIAEEKFNVEQGIKSGILNTEDVSRLNVLQKRLEEQLAAQEQELNKSKLISALTAKGQINLAARVTSGSISYNDALNTLDPETRKAVTSSAKEIVDSTFSSQMLLVKSNGSLKSAIDALRMEIENNAAPTEESKSIVKTAEKASDFAGTNFAEETTSFAMLSAAKKEQLEAINSKISEQKSKWESANKKLQQYESQKASMEKAAKTSFAMEQILKLTAKGLQNEIEWNKKVKASAEAEANRLRAEGKTIGGVDVSVNDKGYLQFASGGYTANSEGLAMLHKKELVLNRMDTENMLKAVQTLREIPQFNTRIPSINGQSVGNNQSIVINAEFPNVSSSDEIKKAFDSMSTKALQYAYRTKSY